MPISIAKLIRFADSLRTTALQCGRAEYTFTDGLHVVMSCQDHHHTLTLERMDTYLAHELSTVFAAAFGVPEASEPVRLCVYEPHPFTKRRRNIFRTVYHWREIPTSQSKPNYPAVASA